MPAGSDTAKTCFILGIVQGRGRLRRSRLLSGVGRLIAATRDMVEKIVRQLGDVGHPAITTFRPQTRVGAEKHFLQSRCLPVEHNSSDHCMERTNRDPRRRAVPMLHIDFAEPACFAVRGQLPPVSRQLGQIHSIANRNLTAIEASGTKRFLSETQSDAAEEQATRSRDWAQLLSIRPLWLHRTGSAGRSRDGPITEEFCSLVFDSHRWRRAG